MIFKYRHKFCVVIGLLLVAGCGNRGSVAPFDEAQVQATKPARWSTITASDAGFESSTMSEILYVQEGIGDFKPGKSGKIKVQMPYYGDQSTVRLKKAILEVQDNSLFKRERITMTCYSGTTLDDVNVVFDPSGLTFSPSAHLTLYLQGPVTSGDIVQVEHIYGSGGNVEAIYAETSSNGEAYVVVSFNVPGFSRYSLGGDR